MAEGCENQFVLGLEAKIRAAYPKQVKHLLDTTTSIFGIKIQLQRLVDLNADFLIQLRRDGLLLSDLAALLTQLGAGSAVGSTVNVKTLQSALSRAQNRSARLPAPVDLSAMQSAAANHNVRFYEAAGGSMLRPSAADGILLQGPAATRSPTLHEAAPARNDRQLSIINQRTQMAARLLRNQESYDE